nr:immunoglobulin light chain junction region [Macaca mulatta]MOW53073.1 immunoglobulin light chain junction region [Macaca mulatta]
CQLHNSHLWTF